MIFRAVEDRPAHVLPAEVAHVRPRDMPHAVCLQTAHAPSDGAVHALPRTSTSGNPGRDTRIWRKVPADRTHPESRICCFCRYLTNGTGSTQPALSRSSWCRRVRDRGCRTLMFGAVHAL